ncbi:MAG: hypothetical protein IT448_12715 [Phycisphaerales bacterium]|nr:hypothetical protein [Phycisphaerales bacterium]
MIVPDLNKAAKFAPERFQGSTLVQSPRSKTMVVGLEAGQAIPVHHPKSDLTMVVISGDAWFVGEGEELEHAGPGAVLMAEAGKARGVRAHSKTVLAVVVSPPPTEEDHRELAEHFKRGTWR